MNQECLWLTLSIDMKAMTNKPTLVNLANHAFFNLAGHDSGAKGLKEHWVQFNADFYTPTTQDLIPTGQISKVEGTKFDFRNLRNLGEMIENHGNHGYDVNFCINEFHNELKFVCRFEHPGSERALECFSNQPGLEFYTGNYLPIDKSLVGKNGCIYQKHGGFVLETQKYPDSINQNFGHDYILRPGQIYDHKVIYKFFF